MAYNNVIHFKVPLTYRKKQGVQKNVFTGKFEFVTRQYDVRPFVKTPSDWQAMLGIGAREMNAGWPQCICPGCYENCLALALTEQGQSFKPTHPCHHLLNFEGEPVVNWEASSNADRLSYNVKERIKQQRGSNKILTLSDLSELPHVYSPQLYGKSLFKEQQRCMAWLQDTQDATETEGAFDVLPTTGQTASTSDEDPAAKPDLVIIGRKSGGNHDSDEDAPSLHYRRLNPGEESARVARILRGD